MIGVVHILNPFEPLKPSSHEGRSFDCGHSVDQILDSVGVAKHGEPFIVFVDNAPTLRAEWNKPLADGQTVKICPVVQGGTLVIILIAVLAVAAVAVALTLSVPLPSSPKLVEPDPVYSLRGQTNQIKLGDPIESSYGRTRIWPSYGAKPYNRYKGNNSYQYQLFCLGQGEYEIETIDGVEQIFIEDTLISDFQDVNYNIVPPGDAVGALFRDNVQTSSEVGSIELYGPNENDYPSPDGWFTATANDSGTTTNQIEVDVVFPRGLYLQNDEGGLGFVSASAEFEYMLINDAGTEIGSWQTLKVFSKRLRTMNAKRFTIRQAVPFGRYKVRGRRTDNNSFSTRVGDTMVWEALRAYLPNVGDYGDVTMLEVEARATSNLNDQSERKFNVIATRKLQTYEITEGGGGWTAAVATRNPVWAFCDIFRANYGADLADDYLDLVELTSIAASLETDEKWFDWTFDNRTTVWEAAKVVARSVRGVPILSGSQIYFVIDKPRTVVQHLFNNENIVQDSFEQNLSLWRVEEFDSIEIEYRDPDTWKTETVICSFGGDQVRPKKVTLQGVTDRDRAYQEGMYLITTKKLQREEIKFATGVEGFLATYGDFIKVEQDFLGMAGTVGGVVDSIEVDGVTVNLSREVAFEEGSTYKIIFRGKDGTPYGPYDATAGANASQVVLGSTISENIVFPNFGENPLFIFGEALTFAKDCVITNLSPTGGDTVNVTAMVYNSRAYENDDGTAPALNDPSSLPVNEAVPTVTGVEVTNIDAENFRVTWVGSPFAKYYIVEVSSDTTQFEVDPNEAWERVGQPVSEEFVLTINVERLDIRVAAVNVGQGPWSSVSVFLDGATRITRDLSTRITRGGLSRATRF